MNPPAFRAKRAVLASLRAARRSRRILLQNQPAVRMVMAVTMSGQIDCTGTHADSRFIAFFDGCSDNVVDILGKDITQAFDMEAQVNQAIVDRVGKTDRKLSRPWPL